jgi:two-component system sensor histidine kinase UhpB
MNKNSIRDAEFLKAINRFQLLSLATKEAIWEYDFVTKESFYNDGITELFGHNYPEIQDNNTWWRNNIHPQDKNRVINALDDLLAGTENVWWGKYLFRCKNGNYKLILDRLFVVRDKENIPLRLIGTMQDLSELDTLEQKFDHIRQEHQQVIYKAVFEAEEAERHSISEELHENINQVLGAINLHIANAKKHVNQAGLGWLEEAQQLLLKSISGIRILSKRLSPISLNLLGLKMALEEMLISLEENNKITYTLLVDDIDFRKVNIDLQTAFYRIAQHQFTNILKHSNATQVTVKLTGSHKKIKMRITDNGNGVDLKKLQYGKGFSTMQQRSDVFGGSFNLESMEYKTGFTMEVMM